SKGIVRTYYSIISELFGWFIELEINNQTHSYIGRPVYYTGGLVISLTTLFLGGTISAIDDHSPELYYEYIKKWPVDLSFFVPSNIPYLIDYFITNKITIKCGKKILVMGAPISQNVKVQARDILNTSIIESWGNTEGLGTITSQDDLYTRPTSIGRPFLTDSLFIIDDAKNILPPFEIGRIAGSTDSRFSYYQNREDLTEQLVSPDMIISEDLGYVDGEGYFYICGREKEVIVTSKFKMFPSLVENMIFELEVFQEVALIGVGTGEDIKPVCAVTIKEGVRKDKGVLIENINTLIVEMGQISDLFVIEQMPKNASGKIDKKALIELYVSKENNNNS
ncbi:MAG: AMP-binding protein, partial [Candidatus Peribacteraceae bacterium]|nr:AMP-binding protein [Candidatus Peribacteraceae bacterium]